jgi:hypothetical protein
MRRSLFQRVADANSAIVDIALSPCGRWRRRLSSNLGRVRGCGGPTSHQFFVVEPQSSPLPQGERAQQRLTADWKL